MVKASICNAETKIGKHYTTSCFLAVRYSYIFVNKTRARLTI